MIGGGNIDEDEGKHFTSMDIKDNIVITCTSQINNLDWSVSHISELL